MAEPTADLLEQFASGAVKPQDSRPQGWLLSLFSRSRGALNAARLQFSAHGGMALLRDAESGHERYLTRFHAARQFLAEAVVRSAEAGDGERDKMRRQLLDAVKQLEEIFDSVESGRVPSMARASSVSVDQLAAPGAAKSRDLPLSFFTDEEASRVLGLLTAEEHIAGSEQTLSRLREALEAWEPGSEPLTAQVFGDDDGFEEVIQKTFAAMSGADVTTNQRAWLSQLGAYLINLSSRWSQAYNRTRQAPSAQSPVPDSTLQLVEEEDDPASEPQPAKTASPKSAKPGAAKKKVAGGYAQVPVKAKAPASDAPAKVATKDAAPAPSSRSQVSRPLNAQHRRKLKEFMAERFQRWQRETGVASEAEVLELLVKAIRRLEKQSGVVDLLCQPLQASSFLGAQRQLELACAEADSKLMPAYKNLSLLCQDLQTAYFQRLRDLLGLALFNDIEQRRQKLADLAAHWAEAAESSGGSRHEEARASADRAVLAELSRYLRGHELPASVAGVAAALAGLESLQAAHRLLASPSKGEPLAMLFRSECKGLVEDLIIRCAFDRAPREGWESLIELLGLQAPRSESELVAMVSRKLDALGQTAVHENFLNPGKRLQFRNFLQWVTNGYRLSPQYQASDSEESVLRHTQWLLEQILSMQFEDHGDGAAAGDSALDQFLASEAETGHAVYNIYWQEIQRRFDGHWN